MHPSGALRDAAEVNRRRISLWMGAAVVVVLLGVWFLGQPPEELQAWLFEQQAPARPQAGPPPPPPKRTGPCLGLTWTLLEQDKLIARVGPDAQSNAYAGDTACVTALSVLCFNGKELGVSAPVPGLMLFTRAMADFHCAARLGAQWRMLGVVDGATGVVGPGELPPRVRFWVAGGTRANPWD